MLPEKPLHTLDVVDNMKRQKRCAVLLTVYEKT